MHGPGAGRSTVVLFTRDLRVADHAGLGEAVRTSEHVVPLFVLDDALLRRTNGANRLAFLLDALADLRSSLRGLGADLVLRRGDPVVETLRVAEAAGASTVVVGDDAGPYARARQERLVRECRRARLDLRVAETTSVIAPGVVTPADRDHYRVFTPYWRRWLATPRRAVEPTPARLRLPPGIAPGELPALGELTAATRSPTLPPGGERAGQRRLERWLAEGLADYADDGNRLDREGSSRLSPYLHFGCVSARELVDLVEGSEGSTAFVRQLCWRDFFLQLLAANPDSGHEDMRPARRVWLDDEETFERWREGRTGYPIVDAGMRQLAAEGWLPNRARLVVGSFLTKTLGLDWRRGAATFFRLLVDADVANNVGNWQWVAATGVDTRPNRVLNPVAQARRFDPDGVYVRRWVPEVTELRGSAAHEPWKARRSLVAPEYPLPIVDPRAPAHSRRGP
jgi:deoxyribodipyrimidine photo-lyase